MISLGRFVTIHTLVIKIKDPKLFPKINYIVKAVNIEGKSPPMELGKLVDKEPKEDVIKDKEDDGDTEDDAIKYKVVYDNGDDIYEIDEDSGVLKIVSNPPSCTGEHLILYVEAKISVVFKACAHFAIENQFGTDVILGKLF